MYAGVVVATGLLAGTSGATGTDDEVTTDVDVVVVTFVVVVAAAVRATESCESAGDVHFELAAEISTPTSVWYLHANYGSVC
jgi:hypothetical protein